MNDTIIRLFNLKPEDIEDISVSSSGGCSFAFISLKETIQHCPSCGVSTNRLHDYRHRELNHAVLNGVPLYLIYNYRRYKCLNCGKIFPEVNPFTTPSSRMSKFSIIRGMTLLKNPGITFKQVADDLNVSVNTVIRMFDKHAGVVQIGIPECLCIDEIYTVKHKQKVYACVLADMLNSQIYDLVPSRKKQDLASYFSTISLLLVIT